MGRRSIFSRRRKAWANLPRLKTHLSSRSDERAILFWLVALGERVLWLSFK